MSLVRRFLIFTQMKSTTARPTPFSVPPSGTFLPRAFVVARSARIGIFREFRVFRGYFEHCGLFQKSDKSVASPNGVALAGLGHLGPKAH